MEIRLAKETDVLEIKNIIDRNFDEIIAKDHSPSVVERFKNHNSVDELYSQLKWKHIYVAIENKVIVGTGAFANLTFTEKPNYCISNLYILPEFQKQGIGHKLVEVLFDDFYKTNTSTFRVPSTRGAVPFYSKFGFMVDLEQNDVDDEITWMTYKK